MFSPAKAGMLAVAVGAALLLAEMVLWYSWQGSLGAESAAIVLRFFLLEGAFLVTIIGGVVVVLAFMGGGLREADYLSLRKIVADAFASRRDRRFGASVGLLYAAFYAVVSGVVVYQPGVDFLAAYGVSSPAWEAAKCCGALGATPSMVVFLSPQVHLALLLVPLDLLLLAVVPVLIGVNATVGSFAYRNRPRVNGGFWLGGFSAVVALFTACPTCAGFFLAGALGGLGATSLAFALAPFQFLFVAVSLPVLVVSPLLVAVSLRRAYVGGCSIEGRAFRPGSPLESRSV